MNERNDFMLSFLNDFVKTILCMGIGFGITFIGKHTNALGIFFVGILLIAFSPAYFLGKYGESKQKTVKVLKN